MLLCLSVNGVKYFFYINLYLIYIHIYIVSIICDEGGQMQGTDETWMNAFGEYLINIDARDTWFWCLNPNSGDTGGLLENDWKTPVIPKLDLLEKVQPDPTKITPQWIGATRDHLRVCAK